MSNMQSQLDFQYPQNTLVPSFYTNVVQLAMVGDEELCLNFAIRSPEKPMTQANLQCRVITTISNVRRLTQGLSQLLTQYDQQRQTQSGGVQVKHPGM